MKQSNFRKNNDGAAILEFAIVGPALMLLLAGFIEVGLIMFADAAIEAATNIGTRIGQSGATAGNGSREDYIRSQIISYTGGFLDQSQLSIGITTYNNFGDIGKSEPCISPPSAPCPGKPGVNFVDINGNGVWDADLGNAGAGSGGSVVLYKVTYPWKLFTPMLGTLIGDSNGNFIITAVAPVRNEPF